MMAAMPRSKRPLSYTEMQLQIGKRIMWARELVEPNRAAFARSIGVDRTTVQKIEDGDRAPSIFNVMDFAHALRVTPDYILWGAMRGIDGELAAALAAAHPELGMPPTGPRTPSKANDAGTDSRPKKPRRRAA